MITMLRTGEKLRKKSVADKKHSEKTNVQDEKKNYIEFSNLDKAGEIALFFGFLPVDPPIPLKEDYADAVAIRETDEGKSGSGIVHTHSTPEKIAILRRYGRDNASLPLLLFYESAPLSGNKSKHRESNWTLEIIGALGSTTEALLVKTAFSILEEEGFDNLSVHLNCLGDKDSITRFTRELTAYYRKHLEEMPAACRAAFKKDSYQVFNCSHEECDTLRKDAPTAISFLSEQSRIHFKELLEYFEATDIPYAINPALMHAKHYCSHTILEVRGVNKNAPEVELVLARGCRFNSLSKKIGIKREIPAASMTITITRDHKSSAKTKRRKIKKPMFYFVHMGKEAKLRSLKVIDSLYKANVRVCHALLRDKLLAQLSIAESMKIP